MKAGLSRGRRVARFLALAYLVGLVLVILAFRFVGERNWIVTIAMYLPRIGFLLPLPFVVLGCLVTGERLRGLMVGAVAALLVLFPLMGLQLNGRGGETDKDGRALRLMSWNTYHGRVDNEAIHRSFLEEKPDVFISQATGHRTKELFRAAPGEYHIENDDEFFIVTRYPVVAKLAPPPFADDPDHRPGFVRYTLQTPIGLIDLYSVHPRSPRSGLDRFRGLGLRTRLMQGDLPDEAAQPIAQNTDLRRRQVEAIAEAMKTSKNPIVVAGDTNLPGLSWLYAHAFGGLDDSFVEKGRGLGYTFPAKRPWMRIDRILTDDHLRVVGFRTGEVIASDHLYVLADLAERKSSK